MRAEWEELRWRSGARGFSLPSLVSFCAVWMHTSPGNKWAVNMFSQRRVPHLSPSLTNTPPKLSASPSGGLGAGLNAGNAAGQCRIMIMLSFCQNLKTLLQISIPGACINTRPDLSVAPFDHLSCCRTLYQLVWERFWGKCCVGSVLT